jgi:hypothetical protein
MAASLSASDDEWTAHKSTCLPSDLQSIDRSSSFRHFVRQLHLIVFQAAKLSAPAIAGDRGHTDRANRLSNRSALQQQKIGMTQVRDILFAPSLPLRSTSVQRADQLRG